MPQRFKVYASKPETGRGVVLNIDADSPSEAEAVAIREGWMVTHVADAHGRQMPRGRVQAEPEPATSSSRAGSASQITPPQGGYNGARRYSVELVTEGGLSTILFGHASLPLARIEQVLNEYGRKGWELVFMVTESRRMLLFWKREAVVLTFARPV